MTVKVNGSSGSGAALLWLLGSKEKMSYANVAGYFR